MQSNFALKPQMFAISAAFFIAFVAPSFALVNNGGASADGDNCSIDRGGLKVPGAKKGKQCCSVFDDTDCVDLPKDPPAPKSINPKLKMQKNLNAPLLKQNP